MCNTDELLTETPKEKGGRRSVLSEKDKMNEVVSLSNLHLWMMGVEGREVISLEGHEEQRRMRTGQELR